MPKTMLVTSRIPPGPVGGRELLSRLHRECLEELCGDDLVVRELAAGPGPGWRSGWRALLGFIDGISPQSVGDILGEARSKKITRLFLNGSNLGHLAWVAKRHLPGVEVLTFFHNVEARFFLGSLKQRRNPFGLGVLLANYVAERKAVRHSDRLIVLSERDSRGLARLYGRAGTDILPMAMEDKRDPREDERGSADRGEYVLFVGGAFYANQTGIQWFVDHVVPEIGMTTYVVGRGLDRMRGRLEREGKVVVVGQVEGLGEWYSNAKAVVAPIFDGSGMKTKVAEALMFGKMVVGTSEAFSGYEEVAGKAGLACDTREEFVAALRRIEAMPTRRFDPELRALYERFYSRDAAMARLGRILGSDEESQAASPKGRR
jgi:glycosyltransferase involved in cell wall biosynthesis